MPASASISASASARKTRAATPGRSGTRLRVIFDSDASCDTPAMIGFSTISSSLTIQVPSSGFSDERTWMRTPSLRPSSTERAIITREVIRECARRLGYRATFTPKVAPDGIGNGVG